MYFGRNNNDYKAQYIFKLQCKIVIQNQILTMAY